MRVANIQRYHLKNRHGSIDSNIKSFAKQRILVSVRDMILVAMGILVGGIACEQVERFTHIAAFCACVFLLSDHKGEGRVVIVDKHFLTNKSHRQTRYRTNQ